MRRLVPVLGSTFHVFATVLALQLLALALGSLLLGPRRGAPGARGAAVLALLAAVPVALLPEAVGTVARWAAERGLEEGRSTWSLLRVRAEAAAVLVLPSTLFGAAVLPWLLRALGPSRAAAGRGAGALLAANTAGSALVALGTALVWIPAVGTAAVLRGAAGLYLLAAALCSGGRALRVGALLAGVAVLAQPVLHRWEDAAGRDAIGAFEDPASYTPQDTLTLLHEEGPVATVLVRDREGRREFWIDGTIEASTVPTDRLHLGLLGHLPMALLAARGVERPRVQVIGLGAGLTAQAVASWRPAELVVHELEPAVVRASELFRVGGGGVPAEATVVVGDGRRGLRDAQGPIDLVTSDPVHPSTAGSAFLYSREHYALVRERLAEDGLVCEWLPLYQMVPDDLRLVARTFADAFPHCYLFLAAGDGLLVGAIRPLVLSEDALRTALSSPRARPLEALGLRAPGVLLGLLLKGPEGLRAFGGEGPLNTDDRLLLELRAGRRAWAGDVSANARLLRIGRVSGATLLDGAASERWLEEERSARGLEEGMRAWLDGDYARTAEVFAARSARDPVDRLAARMRDGAEVELLFRRIESDPEVAAEAARALLVRPGVEDILRLDAAEALQRLGHGEEARRVALEALSRGDWPRARRLAASTAPGTGPEGR
jgi:spermidine synthase